MPSHDPAEFRPAPPRSAPSSRWPIVILILALLGAGAAWWVWRQQPQPPVSQAPVVAVAPPAAVEPAVPPAPVASGPLNPIEPVALPEPALPPLAESDARVAAALAGMLGSQPVASFLQVDTFVQRFVATVDNLARAQAPSRLWPVQPSPQRFTVQGAVGNQTIDPGNSARYSAFVAFAESIDSTRAAAVYAGLYPLFQQAYEALGYPGKYFNDRLVAVIDHLLQAPEPDGPIPVVLTEVKGDMPLTRPWVRYEFADPQLESLSSGQKLLVRVGLVNERRLKAKLRDFRSQIAGGMALKK